MQHITGTKTVVIEIGSNLDAILPPPDDPTVSVLVFEPLYHVAAQLEDVDRRHVVAAAVSDQNGLSMFTMYNDHGLSSSLSTVSISEGWNTGRETDGKRMIVPCVALKDVLHAIPDTMSIWVLKTDMQGFDFRTVQSAGRLITRIPYLITEVSHDNFYSYDERSNVSQNVTFSFLYSQAMHSFPPSLVSPN